jgi:hypothetical protein
MTLLQSAKRSRKGSVEDRENAHDWSASNKDRFDTSQVTAYKTDIQRKVRLLREEKQIIVSRGIKMEQ